MKSICKIAVLFIAFNTWTMISPQKAAAQISVNFQVFYDDLSPYGSWVLNSHYGYVWIPDVNVGFIPYGTNGHWVFTNVGWTWVSHYRWGWAPFHYGRWYYDYIYGWIWVPAYEWGPAWVVWRRCEGYYGWAPIGPGISINIAYGGSYNLPSNQWILVRDRDMGRTNISNYYVRSSDNGRILKKSTVINNIRTDNSTKVRYAIGPNRDEIERKTKNPIKPVFVKEQNKPGHNLGKEELFIYKPKVEKHTGSGQKPMPYKVVKMKDVKSNPSQQQHKEQSSSSSPKSKPEQQINKQPQRIEQPVPQSNKPYQVHYPQELNQQKQQHKQNQMQYPQGHNQGEQQSHKQNQAQKPVPQQQQRYEQRSPAPQPQNHGQQQSVPQQQQRHEQPSPSPQMQNQGQQSHQNHPKK